MFRRIVLATVLLTACDNKGDFFDGRLNDQDRNAALRENLELDLKKTRAFFIQSGGDPQDNEGPSNQTLSKLIAVQDDGTTVEVQVTSGNVEGIQVIPRAIIDTPAYLFFAYDGVQYNGTQCLTIPVRKRDGAMFCVNTMLACPGGGLCEGSGIASNADGSFIYLLSVNTLSRLELKGIGDSVQVELSSPASGGAVDSMVINREGDLLTLVAMDQSSGNRDVRFYKAGGGFVNLARALGNHPPVFAGPGSRDDFYWVEGAYEPINNAYPSLHRVFTSADPVTGASVFTDTTGVLQLDYRATATAAATYTLGMNNPEVHAQHIVEVLNTAGIPRRIIFSNFAEITTLKGCANHLVVAGVDTTGNDLVTRFYPHVPTSQTLAATKNYILSKVAVDSACRITFGGRRASDNARIVGQIEPGSDAVKVVAQDLSADVTEILAIH